MPGIERGLVDRDGDLVAPFRPIHYLGSKLRMAGTISAAIDGLVPSGRPVCDLFAGTGTVAQALAVSRPVVAVDIQEYSRVLCEALLRHPDIPLMAIEEFVDRAREIVKFGDTAKALEPILEYEAECVRQVAHGRAGPFVELVEHGSLHAFLEDEDVPRSADLQQALDAGRRLLASHDLSKHRDTTVVRYFGGLYFSFRQALILDALLSTVDRMPAGIQVGLLASILGAASEVVSTVGKQFAQPMRLISKGGQFKPALIQQALRDRALDPAASIRSWLNRYAEVSAAPHQVQFIRRDFRDALAALSGEIGGVYADPPYTRDHYSRFYHVLETMCLRDNPDVARIVSKGKSRFTRGMYRKARHQSPFSVVSEAPGAFEELFGGVSALGVPLLLSYSPNETVAGGRARVLDIGEIRRLAERHFSSVCYLDVAPHAHNKLNTRALNAPIFAEGEVLLACTP